MIKMNSPHIGGSYVHGEQMGQDQNSRPGKENTHKEFPRDFSFGHLGFRNDLLHIKLV